MVGNDLTIVLIGQAANDESIRFQYRNERDFLWIDMPKDRLTLANISKEDLVLEFRSIDESDRFSKVLTRTWQILPLPDLRIVVVDPYEPVEGGKLSIKLSTSITRRSMHFQYRHGTTWKDVLNDTVEITELDSGPLNVEFRCIDEENNASPIIARSWKVKPLSSIPLIVTEMKIDPPQLNIGGSARVSVTCDRPSRGLLYKFRIPPETEFVDRASGIYKIYDIAKGKLTLEYGVVDTVVGDHSKLYKRSWDVTQSRYKVTSLYRNEGRMIACIADRETLRTHTVGRSDTLGNYKIVYIDLSHRKIAARTELGSRIDIDIPRDLVQQLRVKIKNAVRKANAERSKARAKARS